MVAAAGEPDAALANHLIMGPVILARAGLRFAIKVHGSDISYTVRPHPERFVPYAREGTDAAGGILAGSAHTARRSSRWCRIRACADRTRLGPPGVDVHRFRPHRRRRHALTSPSSPGTSQPRRPTTGGGPSDSFGRDGPAVAARAARLG